MIKIENCDNLELLKSQPNESIDLIYCDILYGTGRNFGDYQDLKPKRDIIESHYLPRLVEMKRVLKQNGSIYLQMDFRISHWIRCLMDDIFGYDNFRNEIIWCYGAGGSSKKVPFATKHDNIFLYSKNSEYNFNLLKDENGSRVKDWWRIQSIADKSGYLQKDNEFRVYNTQKPKALIERIIKASSNKGDTVADFYMGSGTTAEVCYDLKRNFIGCDISEKAVSIAVKRIQDAGGNVIQQRLSAEAEASTLPKGSVIYSQNVV